MVRYPTELDDEYISDSGYTTVPDMSGAPCPGGGQESVSWLRGWNFTTDLYRIMEHAVDELRRRAFQRTSVPFHSMFRRTSMNEPAVMQQVMAMYSSLPSRFRETPPVTGDRAKDLFGFQSANIQATLQLLRMILLSTEDLGVDRKCDVAGELLDVFSKVPVEYLKAISSPLVSVETMLGTVEANDP